LPRANDSDPTDDDELARKKYVDDEITTNALDKASTAEAEAATNDTKYMTPKKTKESIDENAPQVAFGSWVSRSGDTVYQASTDGFVLAWGSRDGEPPGVRGYTDSSNPPATLRIASREGEYGNTSRQSITMPVKKDDYWKVTGENFNWGDIYWIPLS
jgi:hypothetical protein